MPHRARPRGHGLVALELGAAGVHPRPRHPHDRQEERPEQLLHRRVGQPEGCDKCHAGYGCVDAAFDFTDARNIDCLACHDNTGTYEGPAAGCPSPSVNLERGGADTSAGRSGANCGTCHFFGGGGNNVKHGDLEQAMFEPTRERRRAHGERRRQPAVRRLPPRREPPDARQDLLAVVDEPEPRRPASSATRPAARRRPAQRAHAEGGLPDLPHPDLREGRTPRRWRGTGRPPGGCATAQPYEEKDAHGNITYASIKGSFTWATNVTPEYAWFDGTAGHYLLGDRVEARRPIADQHAATAATRTRTRRSSRSRSTARTRSTTRRRSSLIQPKLVAPRRRRRRRSGRTSTGSAPPRRA